MSTNQLIPNQNTPYGNNPNNQQYQQLQPTYNGTFQPAMNNQNNNIQNYQSTPNQYTYNSNYNNIQQSQALFPPDQNNNNVYAQNNVYNTDYYRYQSRHGQSPRSDQNKRNLAICCIITGFCFACFILCFLVILFS